MANRNKVSAPNSKISTSSQRDSASTTTNLAAASMDSKRQRIFIWPEWSDNDVNLEKWDVAHKGGKEKEKGKSPTVVSQVYFDDPEGKVELPLSLKVDSWKRPNELILNQIPVVVENDGSVTEFDLITNNDHLHDSELMRNIICQVHALWQMCSVKSVPIETPNETQSPVEEIVNMWKPWEHIYSLCKAGKGPHLPLYNPYGKYIVRLYWMGCWRKITIDDTIPVDEAGNILFPVSSNLQELWPLLLTKALVKVASLDYAGGNSNSEYGDCSVLHCLSGALPEMIPLQNFGPISTQHLAKMGHKSPKDVVYIENISPTTILDEYRELVCRPLPPCCEVTKQGGVADGLDYHRTEVPPFYVTCQSHKDRLWQLLKRVVGEWQWPEQEWQRKEREAQAEKEAALQPEVKEEKPEKELKEKPDIKTKEGRGKGKEGKDDKKKEKEKDKHKEKSPIEEMPLPEKPELYVFAYYPGTPKYPVKLSALGDMADTSERLRQHGLSHLYPHPVWVTTTRSISLIPPPPPVIIPRWKLIRPRKNQVISADPEEETEAPSPIECLEITSPFLNYKVNAMALPTNVKRPPSSLVRGQSRNCDRQLSIAESDETVVSQSSTQNDIGANKPEVEVIYSPPLSEIASATVLPAVEPEIDTKLEEKLIELEFQKEKDMKEKEKLVKEPSTPVKGDGKKNRRHSRVKGKEKDREDEKSGKGIPQHQVTTSSGGISANKLSIGSELGLVVPGEPSITDDEKLSADIPTDEKLSLKPKKTWIEYSMFYKMFKNIYIYHRPHTYPYKEKIADLKNLQPPAAVSPSKDKKSPASANIPLEDKPPYFLFIDSLEPIEVMICFSVVSRWNDNAMHTPTVEEKKHSSLRLKERDKEKEIIANSSFMEIPPVNDHTSQQSIAYGTLIAEPYCWKSLVTGQPVMRLRTTGTRGAVLSLPIGRHVLRFIMTAPLGYSLHLCSSTKFVFGEEDIVMAELAKESCRFIDQSIQTMSALGKCFQTFGDPQQFTVASDQLFSTHCSFRHKKSISKQKHVECFNKAFCSTLKKYLDVISHDTVFAIRALLFDVTTPDILGQLPSSRPATTGASLKSIHKVNTSKKVEIERIEQAWTNRDLSHLEKSHITTIQKFWRGFLTRRVKFARSPGSKYNIRALEQLQQCWAALNQSEEKLKEISLFLLRSLFKENPDIMPHYPFYRDEWNKIAYADYQGSFPDHPAYSWFIVFREIFYVQEEFLVVPKFYCNIPTCLLRVVNNDTGEDLRRVFQKVAPYSYKPNKKGYTFVAEARTLETSQPAGRWKLRLIGSFSPLPSPIKPDVNNTFVTKIIQDYYVPNESNIITRCHVKVTSEQVASIQVCTSKPDVYIKLMILDHEEELISVVGKGHIVLPAFIFFSNTSDEDLPSKRHNSRSTSRVSTKMTKRSTTTFSPDGLSGRFSISGNNNEEKEFKPHKYIIQALVMRNSWPLSEANWAFVQTLKEQEKESMKVNSTAVGASDKDRAALHSSSSRKNRRSKERRPFSPDKLDDKPRFTLRVVVNASSASDMDVAKDTERADEIFAMKRAWEEAEPGRAAKAAKARMKYLSTHLLKNPASEPSGQQDDNVSRLSDYMSDNIMTAAQVDTGRLSQPQLLLHQPRQPTPDEVLIPLDTTPFLRPCLGEPRFFDENEEKKLLEKKQAEIQRYREFCERVEAWREEDRAARKLAKRKQIEDCEMLQAKLDEARDKVNIPREEIRKKYLEIERQKLEETLAAEETSKADKEIKSPKGKKEGKKSEEKKNKKGK